MRFFQDSNENGLLDVSSVFIFKEPVIFKQP
ncbi:hypothetical protein ACOBV8_19930 (plasmid) [Pseudoalteromonas espejiana]